MGANSIVVAPQAVAVKNLQKPPGVTDPNALAYDLSRTGYLFKRVWSVSVGIPGEKSANYDQLRVVFEIEKTSASTSNKSKVALYNLNAETQKNYVKGLQLVLKAGYPGTADTIFSGSVTQVKTDRKGSDVITTYELGEGEQRLYVATFDRNYPAGTPIAKVIKDLLSTLGLPVAYVTTLPTAVVQNGLTLSGDLKRQLDTILKAYALEWSVQNGAVQVKSIAKPTADQAIELSPNSGLVGIPTKGDGGNNLTIFEALLSPRLLPGAAVSLVSSNVSGFFQIRTVKFEGDSHGQKWLARCEAAPAEGIATATNFATSVFA